MPALPSPGQVVRTTIVHTNGADVDCVTRFYMKYAGSVPSAADLVTMSAAVEATWAGGAKAYYGGFVTLTNTICEDLSSTTGASGETGSSTVGTRAGEDLPASAAAVINYEIARRYRGGHPKGFWPSMTDADISTPQQWAAGSLAALLASGQSIINAVIAAVWAGAGACEQVNVSFYEGFTSYQNPVTLRWRNVPKIRAVPVVDPVIALTARQRIGSQRRRLG